MKYKTGYDFGSHPVLSELIKSFAKHRPVDRPLVPKWDLAFVLSHMCKAPFEPLDKASLFYLSVKTVFLVTLATARRVSEVHAFSIDSDHLRSSNLDGSLILRTQVGFLAKNQLFQGLLILSQFPNYPIFAVKVIILTACYVLSELLRFILIRLNHLGNIERDFSFLFKEIRI